MWINILLSKVLDFINNREINDYSSESKKKKIIIVHDLGVKIPWKSKFNKEMLPCHQQAKQRSGSDNTVWIVECMSHQKNRHWHSDEYFHRVVVKRDLLFWALCLFNLFILQFYSNQNRLLRSQVNLLLLIVLILPNFISVLLISKWDSLL